VGGRAASTTQPANRPPATPALSSWTHRLRRRSIFQEVFSGGSYPYVAGNPEGDERGGGSYPPLRWRRARPDSPVSPFWCERPLLATGSLATGIEVKMATARTTEAA